MDIHEEKVYIFKFPYQQTDFTIPVRADSKQEAADILQKWLSGVQTELAMEFPKVSVSSNDIAFDQMRSTDPKMGTIPHEVLEMRMDTLLLDLGAGQLKGKAKDETIQSWTGHANTLENYPLIIHELEMIKTGQKEIPTKKK